MVRIRLRRQGSKGQPSYRIVVIDQRKARNGKYLENIGHYNPRTRPATEVVKEDRALYWLSVGAQPSDAVRRILDHTGTWERYQRFRAGENIEELINEAKEKQSDLPSPRTKFPAPGDDESKLKAREVTRVEVDTPDSDNLDKTDDPVIGSQEEHEGPPRESDNLLELGRNDDEEKREPAKSSETNENTSELIDAFEEAFNQPGKTQLNNPDSPSNPLRNPDFRTKRKMEEIKNKIKRESGKGERKWKISFKLERNKRDTATKEFLKEQYYGKCQICNFTFPRKNGEPHFVAVYIIGYEEIDDPANSICLCPNHFAMFKYGAKEAPDGIVKQINSYKTGSPQHIVKFQLIDRTAALLFKERHIIDVIALLKSLES